MVDWCRPMRFVDSDDDAYVEFLAYLLSISSGSLRSGDGSGSLD